MNCLTVAIFALIMSVFFSGMKTAFLTANKIRIELDKTQGLFSSRFISIFFSHPRYFLTSVFLGNIIALVIFGIAMACLSGIYFTSYLTSGVFIYILQVVISFIFLIIATEIIPKLVVLLNPNVFLNFFALPGFIFYTIFYPFVLISNKISDKTDENGFHKVDLYQLISDNKEENNEEKTTISDELKLIQNAIEFTNVKVRDCMIPRPEIVALEINSSIEEVKQKFFETGFSKILIYENNFDNLVGYITSKELFKNPKNIAPLIIEIPFVPEAMLARTLLHRLIQAHKSLAVVIDEFGGISGLVTVEDIIEEIFGNIEDEHDNPELIERVIGPNEFIFSGRLEIENLNTNYNLNIPESEEYDTLAGFIFYHYQSFPKINETIVIPPFEFKILKVSKTRIELVHLKFSNV